MIRIIIALLGVLSIASGVEQHILSVVWQPARCQLEPYADECIGLKTTPRFTLHSLRAESTYCGVPSAIRKFDRRGLWSLLAPPMLSDDTRQHLTRVMPGTVSLRERHLWVKYGTCCNTRPDHFFHAAIALTDQLNGSEVRALFVRSIGKRVDMTAIRSVFEESFGEGRGKGVAATCRRDLLTGLRINLGGTVGPDADLKALIAEGGVSGRECRSGIIDGVGIQ